MLNQDEAERGLVFSLLRKPGEEGTEALERLAAIPVAVTPKDISDPQLRRLFEVVLDNAYDETATSTKLAAQTTGVDEFDLVQGVESVDPGALRVYAEAVIYHSTKRAVGAAASAAVKAARSRSPADALDTISQSLAHISLSSEDERIATVAQRIQEGREVLHRRQQSMSAGEVRVAFPMHALNDMVPYLLPGQMALVTGATKTGKSSYAGQLFDYNVKRGMRGVYFHFEDTPDVMDLRRIARQMAVYDGDGVPLYRLLGEILTPAEQEKVEAVRADAASWGERGIEVYCAGWTMEQVIRIWRRLWLQGKAADDPIDFIVVDYLNKAELTPQKMKAYGLYGARGRDAELVKQTAEATGVVAFLVQQEGENGEPYETRQSKQKSQVWISLQRERDEDSLALLPQGRVVVKDANMGRTGAVDALFYHKWMLWG